jgi:hypothetical protein
MKNIMTMTAAVACALALTACGGGGGSGGIPAGSSNAAGNNNAGSNNGTGGNNGTTGDSGTGGNNGTIGDNGTGGNSGTTGDNGTGGGTLTRADEGIWSSAPEIYAGNMTSMQTVILSDGSYWGIYADSAGGGFAVRGVLHGTASISGGTVSGDYTDSVVASLGGPYKGTYSGSASAQQNLNLTYNDFDVILSGANFSMSYDAIYNQSASLSAIAGDYLGVGFVGSTAGLGTPQSSGELVISGSSFTLGTGPCAITGTIVPHGTVNVFDISFTTIDSISSGCSNQQAMGTAMPTPTPSGTTFNGILFQTSGFQNYIELVATSGNNAYFYMGRK